jgi:hypothetical protein
VVAAAASAEEERKKAGWRRIGIVVCGPGGLCDDVRAAVVVEVGKRAKGRTVCVGGGGLYLVMFLVGCLEICLLVLG